MNIGSESETVEFKLTTGEKNEAMETIVAILNKHCRGTLYFGVDDTGFVRGQQVSDSTKKDISRIISDTIEPRITPTIEVLTMGERTIIKVSFSGHNRPYAVKGKYLIRVGTENRRMSPDELKRLIKNEDYSSKWEEELTNYKSDDLDDDALKDFYQSSKDGGRLSMKEYDKEKLLTVIDITKDGYINNGGYALFGKNAKISLKLASYATDNKVTFTDLKLIEGNIYNLVGDALDYVLNRINWRSEIGSRKRTVIPEIPEKALREIIVNAFAHADYETVPEIEIGIHPGKVEIYNPGSFPDNLTPLDFISRNLPSYKRNPLILDILFRSRDVEKSGTGFQRVNDYCKQQNVTWDYRKEAYGFFFEFIRTNVRINVQINTVLTEAEQVIFNLIQNNDGITKSEMAVRIGKSEKTVQRIISSLTKKNVIEREGSNRTGKWKVKI
ncbi:MAG: putative DNA binding domain-containing protein [Lachnospiraceae bacterium]|nr:putative DNA binding domain-containing protein [Lachnospiraceae bacterium]